MKCQVCKGTGMVAHSTDHLGDVHLQPALELAPGVGPCLACETTGIAGQDFDQQSVSLRLPPDDDGTEGGRIEVYCERTGPVRSGRPVRAEVSFQIDVANFRITDLSPALLRVLAEFLGDYAGRMERW
jgi:hypothetical protein